ncbi:unnamed protein product [Somion occarium]|uniref:Wings apart-like protein C-terminal domain-containing protein n=1 Tax=Somion occarium TaxID=3059160 RepID=A0ABP1DN52_9APHY
MVTLRHMQRTYSRKGAKCQGHNSSVHSDHMNTTQARKRRKIEVEVVSPRRSNSSSESLTDIDDRAKQTSLSVSARRPESSTKNAPGSRQGTVKSNSQTLRRPLNSSMSDKQNPFSIPRSRTNGSVSTSRSSQFSPEKTVKDLSTLFDFSEPPKPTPSAKTGGIAKRMLRRSQTDSSFSVVSHSLSTIDSQAIAGPSTPRKLTGAKTESTINLISTSPSSAPQTPSKSKSVGNLSSPPARPSIAATSGIRTYGGKSRSFLVALPTATGSVSLLDAQSQSQEDDILQVDTQEEDFEIRESYSELRARWGVDNSDDNPWPLVSPDTSPGDKSKRKGKSKQIPAPPLPNGMMNDLKSISELRSKGETRRFLDDMGYLFEGLDPKGAMGVRRGSALEIVTKLCDSEFARKAKAADFLSHAWEVLRGAGAGNGDKVLDTILVFFAALAARDPRDLVDLASKSDFISVLFEQLGALDRDNDPLWLISCGMSDAELKRAGISKAEKTSLTALHTMVRKKSALFDHVDIISNRLLVSSALSALSPSAYSSSQLPTLLHSLSAELQPISSRISSYTSGFSLFPPLTPASHLHTPSLLHIDNCLRLLDSSLLGRWADSDNPVLDDLRHISSRRIKELSSKLISLCVAADIASRVPEQRDLKMIAHGCMESLFRVLINLTDDNFEWCQKILEDSMAIKAVVRIVMMSHRQHMALAMKKEADELQDEDAEADTAAQLLDRLCLALGLLTNLVQVSDAAKVALRDIFIDPRCSGKRGCITSCRCSSRLNGVQCLTQVYIEHCKSEDSLELMMRGHIAILLGLLIKNDRENQKIILSALPGSSNRNRLTSLIENAREFALFYAEFAKKVNATVEASNEDDDEDEGQQRDTSMSRMLRDTQGESVARDTIQYLEQLRDSAGA